MPFSQVLGRKIAYAPLAFAQAEHVMKERGMPEWLIAHQRTAGEIAANGGLTSERTEPIRNIVGRAPITARQFVEDHKGMFSESMIRKSMPSGLTRWVDTGLPKRSCSTKDLERDDDST
jgi:hypothetical protein